MKKWVKFGLLWGFFMLIMLNVIFPLLDGTGVPLKRLLVAIPVWLVFGLIFGYVSRKKESKKQEE
jgi:hypothetical protein